MGLAVGKGIKLSDQHFLALAVAAAGPVIVRPSEEGGGGRAGLS